MAGLFKDRLIFDPADLTESDNIGSYTRAGTDGDLISSTNVGGKEGLDVNIINTSVVVSATDLDIRDLTHVSDSVKIGDGTDFLAINADGSINISANFSFAEDSAHVSGDNGAFVLAVRHDAETSLVSADGDYAPLQVDANGRLKVAADLSVTSSSEKAEDSASADGDIGDFVLGIRQDTLASSVSADGDYAALKVNSRGGLWSVPVGTVADDAVDTENPVKIGAKATNAALTAVSAAGDRTDVIADLYRRIWINDSPNIGVNSQILTVNDTEVAFPSALAGRRRLMVQNLSAKDVFIGPTGLSTTSGLRVARGSTLSLEVGPDVNLFAIAPTAGNDVVIFELA